MVVGYALDSVESPLDDMVYPRSPCDGVHVVYAQSTRRSNNLQRFSVFSDTLRRSDNFNITGPTP